MNVKKDQLDRVLPLALQIMLARAAEYRCEWNAALPEDGKAGPLDLYTLWTTYESCASLLAEALDGNYEVLCQHIGDAALPELPTDPCTACYICDGCTPEDRAARSCSRWADWVTKVRTDEWKRGRGDAALPHYEPDIDPCTLCETCPADQMPGGREACQAYRKYHHPSTER